MTSPRSESYRRSEPSRDSREDMDRKYYDSRDKDKDYRSSRDTRDSSDRERNYYSSSRSASTRHFDQDSYKSSRYETSRRSRSPSRRDEYIDRSYKSREYSPTRSSRDRAYSPSRSSRGRINTPETTTRPIRSPAYIPASAYRESSYGRDEKLKVEPFNNYERPCQSTTSTSYTPAPKVYNNISTNAYSARVSSNAPYVPSQPAYSYSHPVPPASSSMPWRGNNSNFTSSAPYSSQTQSNVSSHSNYGISYNSRPPMGNVPYGTGDRQDSFGSFSNLQRQNWSTSNLIPFEKNFYREHPSVRARSEEEVRLYREKHAMSIFGSNIPKPVHSFEEGCFPDFISKMLSGQGFSTPTAIQAQVTLILFINSYLFICLF